MQKGISRTDNTPGGVKHGCETLVTVCAGLRPGESALIVSDRTTVEVGEAIAETAAAVGGKVRHLTIEPLAMHGQEPPLHVAEVMKDSSVVFGVTKMSMAHTMSRKKASLNGARYLSLPDFSVELLRSPSLQVDFRELTPVASMVSDILSAGREALLTTDAGTRLYMRLENRTSNSCPGWCQGPGALASPPDAESNIAPNEDLSSGIVVIDGSIPCKELGLLDEPVELTIEAGRIVSVRGKDAAVLESVLDSNDDPKTRVLAELGFGLNPKARLCGVMLEDEGCRGTVHLGFGSNSTIGGNNDVGFHLDMVLRWPTVVIDGRRILEKGELNL